MHRIAFSMTLDPDGAMHDWVDLPEGYTLLRVPTQEAVHLLGVRGYQEVLLDLCEAERPDVLITHPPYDYLSEELAARLRALGVRLLGYAFDDEIFAGAYGPDTRAALSRIYDRYVTTSEVPWATAPLPALGWAPPSVSTDSTCDVALVGRAYPRRVALVRGLRQAGLRVETRGLGWPEGYVSRKELLALYARAAVVLTTAGWEDRAVPMVKHRLLETAMLGVFQIAEEATDLRRYFPPEEVPSYRDEAELLGVLRGALADPAGTRARAAQAKKRALTEHTWHVRFPALLGPLRLDPPRPPPGRSRLLDQLLLSLATRAEGDQRVAAAAALYEELLRRVPDEPAAACGLGRCLRDLEEPEAAIPWLRRAAQRFAEGPPPCAAALHISLPSFGVGTGLGRLGLFPPAAEPLIFLLAALLELDRMAEAEEVLAQVIDPVLLTAVASTLEVGDAPLHAPFRDRLLRLRSGQ